MSNLEYPTLSINEILHVAESCDLRRWISDRDIAIFAKEIIKLTEEKLNINDHVDSKPLVKIMKMTPNVEMPVQAHDDDAGFDLRSTVRVDIPPGQSFLVGTGLQMSIPKGYCGQINPRSGLATKHQLLVGARIIDSNYRGEIKIHLINKGNDTVEIVEGMRVAQILFLPVLTDIQYVLDGDLDDTVRGSDGFGSSGDR